MGELGLYSQHGQTIGYPPTSCLPAGLCVLSPLQCCSSPWCLALQWRHWQETYPGYRGTCLAWSGEEGAYFWWVGGGAGAEAGAGEARAFQWIFSYSKT